MADWLRQLAPREKMILLIGGVLAVVIVGWRLVWMPLNDRSAALDQQVNELTRLLVDVRRAAPLGAVADSRAAVAGSANLLTLINQTSAPLGLYSTLDNTRQEQGGRAMYVSFRNAPFDVLNAWLTLLELDYGVSVATVNNITFSGTSGLVNGQVLIELRQP